MAHRIVLLHVHLPMHTSLVASSWKLLLGEQLHSKEPSVFVQVAVQSAIATSVGLQVQGGVGAEHSSTSVMGTKVKTSQMLVLASQLASVKKNHSKGTNEW